MIYSQSNLRSFLDCNKYFELRFIQKMDWPGANSLITPGVEKKISLGQQFHELVHMYFSGTKSDLIASWLTDPDLIAWWEHFQSSVIPRLANKHIFSEQRIEIPFGMDKLVAIFDAIVLHEDHRIEILDWKTSHKPVRNSSIPQALQTIVYCQVMLSGYTALNQLEDLPASQLSMTYWYADDKDPYSNLMYSESISREHHLYLTNLIQKINSCLDSDFKMTEHLGQCSKCQYYRYCHKGFSKISQNEADDFDRLFEETRIDSENNGMSWQ